MKRALLAQRLAVVGENGRAAGDSTPPDYRAGLSALDGTVRPMPPAILPAHQRDRWTAIVLPRAEALWAASRRMADITTSQLHTDARTSTEALLRGRLIQLALLIATLVVGALLLGWVASTWRVNTAAPARPSTRTEHPAAHAKQLTRVSALERGQARVLERIATGDPFAAVVRLIAQLAVEVSGARAVRITTGTHLVVHPPGADLSGSPAWSGAFHADVANMAGRLRDIRRPRRIR